MRKASNREPIIQYYKPITTEEKEGDLENWIAGIWIRDRIGNLLLKGGRDQLELEDNIEMHLNANYSLINGQGREIGS